MDSQATTETARSILDPRRWRLVLRQTAWEQALRELLAQPQAFSTGLVRLHNTPTSREVLADSLRVTDVAPQGRDWPILADWCVVTWGTRLSARAVRDRFAPLPYQLLVVLQIDGDERGAWQADLWHGDHHEAVPEWRLTGRRNLTLRHEAAVPSSADQVLHDSRMVDVLTEPVLQRLREATVTLIGAGRNGTQLAFQLAGLGIERLRIIDPDTLQTENLSGMPGVAARDVGQSKVRALGRSLKRYRPDLHLTLVEQTIKSPAAAQVLEERCDLIATCVDSDLARLAATIMANRTLTVHLDIGTSIQRTETGLTMTGDARLLLPRQGCCVCVGGVPRVEDVHYDLTSPPNRLPRILRPSWRHLRAGSLADLNAITVGCSVQLWVDLLMGRQGSSFWQRLEWTPERGLVGIGAAVGGETECEWCGESG